MSNDDHREKVLARARERVAAGEPFAWFDELYRDANGDPAMIPWAAERPSGYLVEFLRKAPIATEGKRAVVVGCGLGDDAEALQQLGFETTAFDISPAAIGWAQERFASSRVTFSVTDLFQLPGEWYKRFDFVFESLTVQAMPPEYHNKALAAVSKLVATRGTLLVVTRLTDEGAERIGPPWAVTEDELYTLRTHGLQRNDYRVHLEADRDPPVRRLVASYTRPPDRS